MIALVLMASLAASPRMILFAEPPKIEVWASEDWSTSSLVEVSSVPGATLAITTRSNMLRHDLFDWIGHGKFVVQIAPHLLPVHVNQFRKLRQTSLVVPLSEVPTEEERLQLSRLGPQSLRFRVPRIDASLVSWLTGFKNYELELDLRGRTIDAEELKLFAAISRARKVVRIGANDSVEELSKLRKVKLVRIVVESVNNQIPTSLSVLLAKMNLATRVQVSAQATTEQLLQFAYFPQLSFEMWLGRESRQTIAKVSNLLKSLTQGIR
jgi:hypothetical protein